MNKKNRITAWISLALTLAVFLTSFAATGIEQSNVNDSGPGRGGVFIPGGVNTSNIVAERVDNREMGWLSGQVVGSAIHLIAKDETGATIDNPSIRTYVYFNARSQHRKAWESGELKIIYKGDDDASWQTCNAFLVNSTLSSTAGNQSSSAFEQAKDEQGNVRIACLAPQYSAIYALVRDEDGANQPRPVRAPDGNTPAVTEDSGTGDTNSP